MFSPAQLAADWRLLSNAQRTLIAVLMLSGWYSASVLIRAVVG